MSLQAKLKNNPEYMENFLHGEEKDYKLVCQNRKIVIPLALQERLVHWYHTTLCHPGNTCTEESIRQHFTWKGMRPMIDRIYKGCLACQKSKVSNKKYGKLPVKMAEEHPWDILCMDLI